MNKGFNMDLSYIKSVSEPKDYFLKTKCPYIRIQSYMQKGPTCGLALCSMLINHLTGQQPDLLKMARELHMTVEGEIFSNDYLAILLEMNNVKAKVVDWPDANEFDADCVHIVAYDKDKDNSPTQNNGNSAHWAMIVGKSEDYLITMHAASHFLSEWNFSELKRSNMQLFEPKECPNWEKNRDLLKRVRGKLVKVYF